MKKSTLDSVELLIPLAADKILLKLEPQELHEAVLPWRRRSRVRRVLNKLRTIKRLHSTWFDYYRVRTDIYVVINTEHILTLFLLAWPQELPQWHEHGLL